MEEDVELLEILQIVYMHGKDRVHKVEIFMPKQDAMKDNEDKEGHVFELKLVEEHQELFKFNPMDECEEIQDVAPYLVDKCKENHNPFFILCEEVFVETLLATTKTFGLFKVFF